MTKVVAVVIVDLDHLKMPRNAMVWIFLVYFPKHVERIWKSFCYGCQSL